MIGWESLVGQSVRECDWLDGLESLIVWEWDWLVVWADFVWIGIWLVERLRGFWLVEKKRNSILKVNYSDKIITGLMYLFAALYTQSKNKTKKSKNNNSISWYAVFRFKFKPTNKDQRAITFTISRNSQAIPHTTAVMITVYFRQRISQRLFRRRNAQYGQTAITTNSLNDLNTGL